MKIFKAALLISVIFFMVSCNGDSSSVSIQSSLPPTKPISTIQFIETKTPRLPETKTPIADNEKSTPILESTIELSEIPATSSLPDLSVNPDLWKEFPVIPPINQRVIDIYKKGLMMGNDPHRFSKIGDCGSTPTWFLGDFDRGERYYTLGKYTNLKKIIQYYAGSFDRTSLAAQSGFNASSVLTPLWADHSQCQSNETPLACEYRVHKPILAFITLGTNDVFHLESFEPQMRKIVEFSIENGVIPVLSTKADNIEKTHFINQTLSKLAQEYQIPLWNYWLAVQPLPDQGLQEDGAHITWGSNHFDDPSTMQKGWPVRNLTALQMLEAIWQATNTITKP